MPRVTSRTPQAKALKKGAKAEFVRSFPMDMPAAEVVALGEAEGILLTAHQVHGIRTQTRAAARDKAQKATGASAVTSRKTGSLEDLLRAIAGELGLGRAIEILEAQRAAVRTALRG